MPTVIPYDPRLVLGNVVDPIMLDNLVRISEEQAPVEAAQEKMNSLISMKRSIDMTIQELVDMKVDPSEVIKNSGDLGKEIAEAAIEYANIKIEKEKNIQQLKSSLLAIGTSIESPIDYNRSVVKTTMPLSADSLKMDSQYFSFDSNEQSSANTMSSIKSFISGQFSTLGYSVSSAVSNAVQSQVSQQRENHNVEGTLIISANCTHKNAVLLAPFILDVDKAIRVWNSIYKDPQDKIKVNDLASLARIAQEEGTDKEKFLPILSGATYGSCFVGMVHILKNSATTSSQTMLSVAEQMQSSFKVAGWFANASGGIGADSSFSADIKNMLSTQQISSHINVISMGLIPSIKANTISMGVKEFAGFDPKTMGDQLAALQNATATDHDTVNSSATAAQVGGKLMAMQSTRITSVMSGLKDIEKEQNQILDVNSLMTGFQDYIDQARAGNIGVPINYYLKNITRAQLAQMWVAKYYPGYIAISGDDSASGEKQQ